MKKIAIIPVRSGSKRFHEKNFKSFKDTTLIRNTIDKLEISKVVDKIYISTDNIEKSDVAAGIKHIEYIKRSSDLSNDDAKIEDVILDVIEKINISPDYIIILTQVTSPNWSPHRLVYALKKLEHLNVDSVISVSPDLKPNGCFYIFRKSSFLKHNKIYSPNIYLIKIPWEESVDIDFEYQLYLSEAISKGNYDMK